MTAQVIPLPPRRLDLEPIDRLQSLVNGVQVRFHPSMPPHVQRLMATLGARIIFDPSIPRPEAWDR